ncbi:patched domain-containing protein 3-like [Antedon mediterranea]|uniref:patched domain-containing protein 3-like n=1 Tax=Antedon mediterranea TaxID=105859 RepID=UPI003AF4B698
MPIEVLQVQKKMEVNLDCISRPLSNIYAKYARVVCRHPLPFIFVPVIVSLCLGSGFQQIKFFTNIEYLSTPKNAESKRNRDYIDDVYNIKNNGMLVNRLSMPTSFGRVIISGSQQQNILQSEEFMEVIRVHETILDISVVNNGLENTFRNMCLSWMGDCATNSILEVYDYDATKVPFVTINYPFTIHPTGKVFGIATELGDVTFVKETDIVKSAKYIRLSYYLKVSEISELWEEKFLKAMEGFDSEVIRISRDTSTALSDEFLISTFSIIPLIPIAFLLIVSFSLISSATMDWVVNKPILTLLGVVSAVLGGLAANGLLLYFEVTFTAICALTPIIIMSIGIDDMYILIASWRKTNVRSSVEDRLSETLSEAALSITITSLTDFIAFAVGCTSVFPGVSFFCIYNAVSILFVYVYVLTFFLSCMVITGRREASNRHCITCKKVVPGDVAHSSCYRILCAGGTYNTTSSDSSHIIMVFFRDYFGPLMGKSWMKIAALLVYAMYIGFSTWGVTQLKKGLDFRDIVLKDSYVIPFQDIEQNSFQTYGPLIQIVFTEEIEYWHPDVINYIMELHNDLETSKYGLNSEYFTTDSWIRSFKKYLSITGQAPTNGTIFLNILQNQFLVENQFKHFELDLVFNEDRTRIIS